MTGRVEGKIAFITGAARGQGRSHAIRLAQEGADIIAVDISAQVGSVPYPMATPEDLAETVKEVEALDRRIVAAQADVRDFGGLKEALDQGVAQLGRLDIVCSNAGISSFGKAHELDETTWRDVIDISSDAGLKAYPNLAHYLSAKHGVVGLMRTLALELAPHFIRVNSLHPSTVDTDMIQNEATYRLFRPDLRDRGAQELADAGRAINALPIPWLEPVDISNAVLFLASDEARYITGVTLPVDAGFLVK
jgi:NAD(P)-dependent dehydrogenase (short-subunit alcohol dehydrogenase family)